MVAGFRALRSIVIVASVALLLSSVRSGDWSWQNVVRVAVHYRTAFLAVFLGLFVWELWYRRAKRHHAIEQRE